MIYLSAGNNRNPISFLKRRNEIGTRTSSSFGIEVPPKAFTLRLLAIWFPGNSVREWVALSTSISLQVPKWPSTILANDETQSGRNIFLVESFLDARLRGNASLVSRRDSVTHLHWAQYRYFEPGPGAFVFT